jgi:hypothetical protein
MATAREIVDRVNKGEIILIPRKYVGTFMQQCDIHGVNCSVRIEPVGRGLSRIYRPELQQPKEA